VRIPNLNLLISPLLLSSLSLFIIITLAQADFENQLLYLIISLLLYFFISQIDFQFLLNLSPLLYVFINLLLILTLFFSNSTRGSNRWLSFGGFSFQTSEFLKPILILSLANITNYLNLKKTLHYLIFILIFLIPSLLIFLQPDLGTTMIILAASIFILINSKVSKKLLFSTFLIILISLPIVNLALKPYQKDRITSFFQEDSDSLGTSYNQIQAVIAAGSGQLFGKGLGKGTQSHLQFLPEKHTDFFFATAAEEFGFIGSCFIILLFFYLGFSLIKIANKSKNQSVSIFCLGVFILILFQAFTHIAINLGLLPVTGLTLPFMSVGGSSLISTYILLGLASSASKSTKLNHSYFFRYF
jgi:rod shape determining protein RodA